MNVQLHFREYFYTVPKAHAVGRNAVDVSWYSFAIYVLAGLIFMIYVGWRLYDGFRIMAKKLA